MKYIVDMSEDDFSDISEGGFLDSEQRNRIVEAISKATPYKTGHWVDGDRTRWKYSNCGYGVLDWNNTPYCPNCGVKMESESK